MDKQVSTDSHARAMRVFSGPRALRRWSKTLGLAAGLAFGVAQAATTTLDTLVDTDNNPLTGCSVATAGGPVSGVERIIRTTVDADSTGYRARSVEVLACVGSSFGAPQLIDGTVRTIDRGLGVSGATAVETVVSDSVLSRQPSGARMRVAFAATGSDGLVGADALNETAGSPILIAALPLLAIPALGALGLALLAATVLGAGLLAHRRGYRGTQLVIVALVATALSGQILAAIVRDGRVLDWAGVSPIATDPAGDAPPGVDIVAAFSVTEQDTIAFRTDVVLNATPSADGQSVVAKVGETLPIVLTGSDFEGSPLTFTIVTPPTQGVLGGSGANITYTPNPGATASDSFTFRANDGQLDSAPATVSITNTRAPAITSASSVTFTPLQANSFTVLANGMPTPTTSVSGCSPSLPASVSFTPDSSGGGVFTGTPGASDAGSYTCTITANNGVTPTATQTFTLTVGGPPTITSAATLPDAREGVLYSAHTLTATALLGTPPFQITALAQTGAAPAGLALGVPTGLNTAAASVPFTGTPAACTRGVYSFNFSATNSFGTTTQTVRLNVLAVNTAPSFTGGGNVTVNEDAGAQSIAWASAISPGPSCEAGQTVVFSVVNNNAALFSVQPTISPTGLLTFTPTSNASGVATVTVTLQDNGGTANGGSDTSAPVTFTLTVNSVNDPPSFTKGPDITVLEDSGAFSQAAWASAISPGPPDEATQTVSFEVSNSNSALFSAQPALSPTGTLTFTPAPNAHGVATVTVIARDTGGTANGGVDASAPQTFTITITPVNDAPSFTKGPDVTVLEDAGPQSIPGWATAISPGPNEATQTVSFLVTANSNPSLFATAPAVSSAGTLTFTPAPNAFGSATITLVARDDGGTANGGVDTSTAQTFVINVTAVNDPPIFVAGPNVVVTRNSGAYGPSAWASGISAGPANESGQVVTFEVTGNTNPSLFAVAPTLNGSGQLSFTPATDQSGAATVTVRARDDGGVANGGQDRSAAVSFTISVVSPPTITSPATAVFPIGVATTFTITTAAFPPVSSITLSASPGPGACTLPPGLAFAPSGGGTATISGTASTSAPVNCLVTASNGVSPDATQVLSIVPGTPPVLKGDAFQLRLGLSSPIGPPPTWNVFADNGAGADDLGVPAGAVVSFGGGSLGGTAASNAPGATVTTVSGGINVMLAADGALIVDASGGGAAVGTYSFDYVVGNATGTDTATVTVLIGTLPSISGVPPAGAVVGSAYGPFTFTVGGSPAPSVSLVSGSCTLPAGITLSAAGVLSGTPSIGAASATGCVARATNAFGTADSSPFSITVSVPPPTVTTSSGTVTFVEGGSPVVVDAGLTVTSAGTTDLLGATVSIVAGFQSSSDVLAMTPAGGISGSYNAATGVLTLTGVAPVASYQTVLRSVVFSNSSEDPSSASRTVSFVGINSAGSGAAATRGVNVTPVNDPPSFLKGPDVTVAEDSGPYTANPWATGITAVETGQTVSFEIVGNTNPGLFSAGPAVSAAGVLTFTPAAHQNGSATITLQLRDSGGTANGGVDVSPTQTFTITVTPVNDPPVAQNKNGGIVQANMRRIGINADLLSGVTDADAGINGCSPTFSVASITGNTGGTVSNVNLAAGTFDFDPAPGFVGTATVNYTVADNGCPGSAVSAPATISLTVAGPVIWFLNPAAASDGNGTLGSPFNSLSSAVAAMGTATSNRLFVYSGTTAVGVGINLTGATSQAAAQWLIGQGATGTSFDDLMGIAPPTGTIARPTLGGTRPTLRGTITLLGSNVRAQGFDLSTGTLTGLADAVAAVTGVSVSEVAVTTTTGTAVNLSDLDGVVSLSSVSSDGGATGIALSNVNTVSGSFTVTGGGTAGSGGTVRNKATGISLSNARNVSFNWMQLNDFGDYAIRGSTVTGFTLGNSVVSGTNGNDPSAREGSVRFNQLLGTATINASSISGGLVDNLLIENTSGTLNRLTIDNSTIGANSTANGNDGVLIEASGSGTVMNVTVRGTTFTSARGDLFQLSLLGTSTGDLVFENNTLRNGHPAIATGGGGVTITSGNNVGTGANLTVNMTGNTFRDAVGHAVLVVKSTDPGTLRLTFDGNTVGVVGVPNSGSAEGSALRIQNAGLGTLTALVSNNRIHQYNNHGIELITGGGASPHGGAFNATITSNTISNPGSNPVTAAIAKNGVHLNAGTVPGDTYAVCTNIGGAGALANALSNAGAPNELMLGGEDIRLRQRQSTTVALPGYGGTSTDTLAVNAYLVGRNGADGTPSATSSASSPPGGGYVNVASCALP